MTMVQIRKLILWITLTIVLLTITACSAPLSPDPDPTHTVQPSRTPRPTRTPASPQLATNIPTPAEPTATPLSADITTDDLDGMRVTFWHPWTEDLEFTVLSLVNEFNASNPYGIVVTAFSQGGDMDRNVRASFGSADPPHIVTGYNNQLQSWDNLGGVIADLDPYLNHPEWGFSPDEQADFYPIVFSQDTNAEKRLGMPAYRSGVVIFYNQTWAKELGFDALPQTPEELAEQACASAAANNDGTGGWIASTNATTMMNWLFAFDGSLLTDEGDKYQATSPENEAAFRFVRGLVNKGCAWQPESWYPNDEFATRQALFYPSSIAGIPYQARAFESAGSQDEWLALPFPSKNSDPVFTVYGPAFALYQPAKPDDDTEAEGVAAWLFIRWLMDPSNQARLATTGSYLPVRASALVFLNTYQLENPVWAQAAALAPYSRTEPGLGSWGVARWAVRDAVTELLGPASDSAQIPDLLARLEATLNDIHANNP